MTTPIDPQQPEPAQHEPVPHEQVAPMPSASKTRTRRTAILIGVGGVLLGGSVGWAATDSTASATPAAHHAAAANGAHKHGPGKGQHGQGKGKHHNIAIGQISAINGNTWTVDTRRNGKVTVTITAQTAFGTKKQPQQQGQFGVGDQVVIVGKHTGTAIEARRIAKRVAKAKPAPASSAPAPNAQN